MESTTNRYGYGIFAASYRLHIFMHMLIEFVM